MKILIVSATRAEIQPLLDLLRNPLSVNNKIEGEFESHSLSILMTGVGMVATAYHCAKSIAAEYDLAINVGVCGSFTKNLELGQVLNVYEDKIELGAEDGDNFLDLQSLGLEGIDTILNKREQYDNPVIHLLPRVSGITVNTVHGKKESIEKVYSRFHPFVESMEGAAFMYCCEMEQIPYLQLRAVSNYVEPRNKDAWELTLAIINLNATVIEILKAYKN